MRTRHSISASILPRACAVLLTCFAATAFAADDPVLLSNGTLEVRRSDYETELLRLAPDMRGSFATAPARVYELLEKMLYNKLYAAKAREEKLDHDPAIQRRLALETERFYGIAYTTWLEEKAAQEFDADLPKWEARARELYTIDLAKYVRPERVSVSHILFKTDKRSSEDARALAAQAAARAGAGENFNELARSLSEDATVKRNDGRIDYFPRGGNLDPAFVNAAFALKNPGDVSEPVLSRFGWHLIKLEGRQVASQRSFDEVKAQIITEFKRKFVDDRRNAALAQVRATPGTQINKEAIDALIVPMPASPRAK
jgi:peptidyl-prolyl cis-trans isomerase C